MKFLLSRKFIVALVAIVGADLLCAFGIIHEGVYSAIIIAVVGGYLTANVTQKAATKPMEVEK